MIITDNIYQNYYNLIIFTWLCGLKYNICVLDKKIDEKNINIILE
jgi:hypothetical protein